MYRSLKVAAVIPCKNEELKITRGILRLQKAKNVDQIILVDDGSTDRTAAIAESMGVKVIRHKTSLGVGAALRTGIEAAKKEFDVIVILAGNDKDEPLEIPRLLDPIAEGRADFVQGSRYLPGGKAGGEMPAYRRVATRIHPLLFSLVSGKRVTDSTNGFRAIRTSLFSHPKLNLEAAWLNGYELEPYLYLMSHRLGFLTLEVPITKTYPPRNLGYTKMRPIIDWWKILRPLFT